VRGWLRTLPGDPEATAYGYEAQYGYDPAASGNWQAITNWTGIDLGTPYNRLAPGTVRSVVKDLTAPAANITLCFRLWKKWPTASREVDLNLDGLSLTGYK